MLLVHIVKYMQYLAHIAILCSRIRMVIHSYTAWLKSWPLSCSMRYMTVVFVGCANSLDMLLHPMWVSDCFLDGMKNTFSHRVPDSSGLSLQSLSNCMKYANLDSRDTQIHLAQITLVFKMHTEARILIGRLSYFTWNS